MRNSARAGRKRKSPSDARRYPSSGAADLLEQAEYYDAQGGESLGDRFIAECETGFARLAAYPESGTLVRLKHPRLAGRRFILAPGFDGTLIFYKLVEDKVQVIRVLHGARDIEAVLERGA